MNYAGVAKRYAQALFEVAQSHGILARCAEDLRLVRETVTESKELETFLENPTLPADAKKGTLRALFEGKVHAMTLNTILLLVDRGRERTLVALSDLYQKLADEAEGKMTGRLETAVPVEASDVRRAEEWLSDRLGTKLALTATVNADLIGGVRFRIGDRVMDATVKSQLARFARQLDRANNGRAGVTTE